MGTAKFDDSTPDHPKFIAAGAACSWLWFAGVCYARRVVSDGFIPREKVPTLVIGLPNPFKHAARLVECGLWHEATGGFQVHDFHDWNPSKVAVSAYRKKDRERKQRQHGIRAEGSTETDISTRNGSSDLPIPDDAANARGTHARTKSESESESERFGSEGSEESARETTPADLHTNHGGRFRPVNPVPAKPLIDGAAMRRHGQHARCYFDRGLCVTPWVWEELLGRLGGEPETAVARLGAWMDAEVASTGTAAIGDGADAFWRKRFAATHGVEATPTAAGPMTRGLRTADAFDQAHAALVERPVVRR